MNKVVIWRYFNRETIRLVYNNKELILEHYDKDLFIRLFFT